MSKQSPVYSAHLGCFVEKVLTCSSGRIPFSFEHWFCHLRWFLLDESTTWYKTLSSTYEYRLAHFKHLVTNSSASSTILEILPSSGVRSELTSSLHFVIFGATPLWISSSAVWAGSLTLKSLKLISFIIPGSPWIPTCTATVSKMPCDSCLDRPHLVPRDTVWHSSHSSSYAQTRSHREKILIGWIILTGFVWIGTVMKIDADRNADTSSSRRRGTQVCKAEQQDGEIVEKAWEGKYLFVFFFSLSHPNNSRGYLFLLSV